MCQHRLKQKSANCFFFHILPPFGHPFLEQLVESVVGIGANFPIPTAAVGLMSFCHLAVVKLPWQLRLLPQLPPWKIRQY
jgi:hypothetical protein